MQDYQYTFMLSLSLVFMHKKLTAFLFFLVTTAFAQAPTNGLIAYYPFNGNPNDASGNHNNGIINGTINSVNDHNGTPNGAYQFTDGSKIRVANNPSLKLTTSFSYSGWVRLRSLAGRDGDIGAQTNYGVHPIFSKNCDRSWLYSIMNALNSNTIIFTSGTWYDSWLAYYMNYTPTNWIHVALSYDSTKHTLSKYVNGKLVAANRSHIDFTASNSSDLILGGMDCWNYFFNGDMDELRFYNRELTEQDVAATYEYEKAPITSINHGNWEDTSVWSCNCVPTKTDVVRVKHIVNVPAKSTAYAWNVQYSNDGQVTLGSSARLLLSK